MISASRRVPARFHQTLTIFYNHAERELRHKPMLTCVANLSIESSVVFAHGLFDIFHGA